MARLTEEQKELIFASFSIQIINNAMQINNYVDNLDDAIRIVLKLKRIDKDEVLSFLMIEYSISIIELGSIIYATTIKNKKGSSGENEVKDYLNKANIPYTQEHRFSEIKNLRFDFYIPSRNLCIEYDGLQHFKPVDFFGGEESFKLSIERDKIKDRFCVDNNINLIRIPYYYQGRVSEFLEWSMNGL